MSTAFAWVRELAHQQHVPVPWARMVRITVAIVLPVTAGVLFGQLGIGLLCSIGALGASLADADGPYRARVVRVGWAVLGGVVGFVVGGAVLGRPVPTAVVIVAGGLVAGTVSILGAVASVASLQFLIYVIVASGADFGPVPPWLPPACYVVGAAWALALSLAGGIGRASAPERAAVGDVYARLADYMDASGTAEAEASRRALTVAMNKAYDAVMVSRAAVGGSDRRLRRLAALVNAASPLIESTTARASAGTAVPEDVGTWVREAGDRIRRGVTRGTPLVDVLTTGVPAWRDMADGLDAVDELVGLTQTSGGVASGPSPVTRALRLPGAPPPRRTVHDVIVATGDAFAAGPSTWMPTLRLVLCLAAGELVAAVDPTQRRYWIVMTVAVVLKPDFGSVFARAVQRGTGTVVGVLIGSVLLALSPGRIVPLVAIAVFAALMSFAQRRNYGMFATFLTPVIVLLLDLGAGGGFALALSRVVDTAIGCVIVLVVGYLPWPDTWRSRTRFGPRIDHSAGVVADYIRIALGDGDGLRPVARRRAYRELSDLRTRLQQALSEPPPVSRVAAVWWPIIVTLERTVDAVTAVALRGNADDGGRDGAAGGGRVADTARPARPARRHGVTHAARRHGAVPAAEQLAAATEAIGSVALGGDVAAVPPVPADTALEPVAAELRAAQAVLRRMVTPATGA